MKLEFVLQVVVLAVRGNPMPSHVLTAIGNSNEMLKGALRLTFGRENTKEDVDFLVENLKKIIYDLRGY